MALAVGPGRLMPFRTLYLLPTLPIPLQKIVTVGRHIDVSHLLKTRVRSSRVAKLTRSSLSTCMEEEAGRIIDS